MKNIFKTIKRGATFNETLISVTRNGVVIFFGLRKFWSAQQRAITAQRAIEEK